MSLMVGRDAVPGGRPRRGCRRVEDVDLMARRLPSTVSAFTVLVFVFLYLPIVIVVINSFNADEFLLELGRLHHPVVQRGVSMTSESATTSSPALEVALASSRDLARDRGDGRRCGRAAPRAWSRRALDATTYMRIVLPEVVLAIGALPLRAPATTSRSACRDRDRPRRVQLGVRHHHHPGPAGDAADLAGGGGNRSRCVAAAGVPARHAAAADAGHHRRRCC